MAFLYNCVTFSGAQLLAQASSANPIVYIGAVAGTEARIDTELKQMSDRNDYRWDVQGGEIIASSATFTTARIIAGFRNRASEVTIKTIGVVARLSSQTDAEAVVLAAISDPNASIRIPPTSEPPVTIEAALNITISDELSVTVTSSTAGSAMLSDMDRLVSCHKAGQPSTGEEQTVYGIKRFNDTIYAPNIILGSIETEDEAVIWTGTDTSIRILRDGQHDEALHLDTPIVVAREALEVNGSLSCNYVDSDLIPSGSNNLGGEASRWYTLYASNINATSYTGGVFDGDVTLNDRLMTTGRIDIRGGYTIDNSAPLSTWNCPLVPDNVSIQIGGIFLAIVVSTSGASAVTSGQTIPSTVNIFKAEGYSQATGGLLAPSFGSGSPLTNDGSSYVAINGFSLSGRGQQALALCIRIK